MALLSSVLQGSLALFSCVTAVLCIIISEYLKMETI